MEDCRIIVNENDDLRQQLSIKNRELLRDTKERAEHAGDAAGLEGEDAITGEDGKSSTDQLMELKQRAHLLSEENQVLFQQITVLRSHYDEFNQEQAEKTDDANQKINMFSRVEAELLSTMQ